MSKSSKMCPDYGIFLLLPTIFQNNILLTCKFISFLLTVNPNGCPGTFLRPTTFTVSVGMSPFCSGLISNVSAVSLLSSFSDLSTPEPRSSQILPI